jgi:hypothetical protein
MCKPNESEDQHDRPRRERCSDHAGGHRRHRGKNANFRLTHGLSTPKCARRLGAFANATVDVSATHFSWSCPIRRGRRRKSLIRTVHATYSSWTSALAENLIRAGETLHTMTSLPPDHSAATSTRRHQSAIQPSRPGVTRRTPAPITAPDRAQAPAAGPPGYDPALAPRPAPPTPRQSVATETLGPTTHHPVYPSAGSTPGHGEPELGLPPNPRRTARPRHHGGRLDRVADPHQRRHCPCTRTRVQHLGPIPPFPNRGPAGLRLPRNRHAHRRPHVRAGRHRTRQPTASGPSAPQHIRPRPG